jgi:hypothetical protein
MPRIDSDPGRFHVTCTGYTIECTPDGLPSILLSAELELAAWDTDGRKLWTTFVEPPWGYTVEGDRVHLDVMGNKQSFTLRDGPPKPR